MALGAADKQAAGGLDLFGLLGADLFVLVHAFAEHRSCLENFLIVGLGITGSLGDDPVCKARLAQVVFRQIFGIAAEHDIGTAAGHVGGYGDRTELTCLRDYLRFLLMVLCVEHIVLDTALFKQI